MYLFICFFVTHFACKTFFVFPGACVIAAALLALTTKCLEKKLVDVSDQELCAMTLTTDKQQLQQSATSPIPTQ